MIKNYKSMNVNELKKILLKKGFKISRLKKKSNFGEYKNLITTSYLSLILILIFSILPGTFKFIDNSFIKNTTVENNSKKYLEKVLSGESLITDNSVDSEINQKYLLDDIELSEGPSKSVRIEASTLNQIFEEKDYNLSFVKKNKIVKPFEVGMLPNEIKMMESSKQRKDLFIKIVLPLILSENNRIKRDRNTLFKILNRSNNTKTEKDWLNKKFRQYGVVKKDITTLKIRMDQIPVSLAIAQAAKESGWGTSRFAIEGNALFGQWTYSGEGIKPAAADKDTKHKIMTFNVLKASVRLIKET